MADTPHQQWVVCLMGPTASGKTDLAMALRAAFPFEIISVDSAQIYQGLDIGSGKPSASLRQQIPHHLMDKLPPQCAYSAAQFCSDALLLIQETLHNGKVPLLVGGTMLYFKALQQGLSVLPGADPLIRERLMAVLSQEGVHSLYARLVSLDPTGASRLKPNDMHRIVRALEIIEITGKTPLDCFSSHPPVGAPYRFINIGLTPVSTPRSVLHERIEARFEGMLENGLVEEVRALLARGDLTSSLPSLRAVGYRQVIAFLEGKHSFEEMKQKAIAATRQLAKRQLTWLRHWPCLTEFDFLEPDLFEKVVNFLEPLIKKPLAKY